MRSVIGIAIVLLGIGIISCRWGRSTASAPQQTVAASWVRTVDGWERAESWQSSIAAPPRLHPLVVAAGQALLSILALVAAAPADPLARQRTGRSAPIRRRSDRAASESFGSGVVATNR